MLLPSHSMKLRLVCQDLPTVDQLLALTTKSARRSLFGASGFGSIEGSYVGFRFLALRALDKTTTSRDRQTLFSSRRRTQLAVQQTCFLSENPNQVSNMSNLWQARTLNFKPYDPAPNTLPTHIHINVYTSMYVCMHA